MVKFMFDHNYIKYLSMDSSGSTRGQLEQAEGGHKNTPAVKIVLKLRKRSPLMLDLT